MGDPEEAAVRVTDLNVQKRQDSDGWPAGSKPVAGIPPDVLAEMRAQAMVMAKAERYRDALADELARQFARRDAKRMLDTDERSGEEYDVPEPTLLTDLLVEEMQAESWRIHGVWPAGANILMAAGAKAGKTTTTGNVVRSLVDGDRLFKVFKVEPIDGSVGVVDFEMPRGKVKEWLHRQGIVNTQQVAIWTQRGQAQRFDLRDPDVRKKWVRRLKASGVQVLLIDCLSPVLSALGINENDNTEVGRMVDGVTSLGHEAELDEILLIHHMGHGAERARGASRLLGWPDVNWRINRKRDEKNPQAEPTPDSPRYFSAYGRDVDVREGRMLMDDDTRHLTYVEGGRSADDKADALGRILVYIKDHPRLATSVIEKRMAEMEIGRNLTRRTLEDAEMKNYIANVKEKGNGTEWEIKPAGHAIIRQLSKALPPTDEVDLDANPSEHFCGCGAFLPVGAIRDGLAPCPVCNGEYQK